MINICVLQTDNRINLDYLLKTQIVNKKYCTILNYDYLFIKIDDNLYTNLHPAMKKIFIVNNFLNETNYDILVFLDSDAWIQNYNMLNNIINDLINNKLKNGCYSRDPYFINNTYINSGSFILKNNIYIKEMYKKIINEIKNNNEFYYKWPFDQFYISNYVFENKDNFIIYEPDILNTPYGKILRHNWYKNNKMFDDLNKIINNDDELIIFNDKEYYDNMPFPNLNNDGNYYY